MYALSVHSKWAAMEVADFMQIRFLLYTSMYFLSTNRECFPQTPGMKISSFKAPGTKSANRPFARQSLGSG
jgi:hypothetical protein